MKQFERTRTLLGDSALEKLNNAKVAIFGIGGVGSYVAEALARVGIGNLDFIDNDTVKLSNINRQIVALHSTLGMYKTDVMKARALDINPKININTFNVFFLPENKDEFDFTKYDYIVDAIDTVKAKIALVESAKNVGVPIVSSMGTGNKLNPTYFEIADISKTSVCPLARVMRIELKKRGIKNLKVLYSKELPVKNNSSRIPSSVSFVPSVAGLIIASEVVKDLIGQT
ncbi:tRNA threonylcarbamoyladenosine dehydratase [bacterium]|nr:tRNA threonylcarbamoyladenosine dehydratase [bacterium]